MNLQLMAVTPLSYFKSLVETDADFPLLEAAASIAQDEEPQLDVQDVLATADALLVRLRRRLKIESDPLKTLSVLNQFFYTELGYSGREEVFQFQLRSSGWNLHRHSACKLRACLSLVIFWSK